MISIIAVGKGLSDPTWIAGIHSVFGKHIAEYGGQNLALAIPGVANETEIS